MFFFRGKRNTTEIVSIGCSQHYKKYKTVTETYRYFAIIMSLGLMYPNPKTDKKRQIVLPMMFLSFSPVIIFIITDMHIRFQTEDMENFIRQLIVLIALIFAIIKATLTLIHRDELREVFNIISTDYIRYNDLPEDYHVLIDRSIKKCKLIELSWTIIIACTGLIFPGSAVALNVYSLFFTDTPRRFMVHESHILGVSADTMYSTPVYEFYFIYCTYVVNFIFLVFTAFDGMFSVSILHASLKLQIISNKLKHLLDDKSDLTRIKQDIAVIVEDQIQVYYFIGKIMKCYESWLVMMFTVSVMEIGMTLIQITSRKQVNGGPSVVFTLFMCTSIAHILFPCYLCSDVTYTAALLPEVIYSIPWEDVEDAGFRRSISFMITRSQIPINITALNLLTFNMEMFVSVLQTAYSMFTLLRG